MWGVLLYYVDAYYDKWLFQGNLPSVSYTIVFIEIWFVKHTQVLLWLLGYFIDEKLMSMFVYTSVRIAYWADITVLPLGLFLWIFAFFTTPSIPISFQWPLTLIFAGG